MLSGAALSGGAGHTGHGSGGGLGGLVLSGPLATTLAVTAMVAGLVVAGTAVLALAAPRSRPTAGANSSVIQVGATTVVAVLAIGWLGEAMTGLGLLATALAAAATAVATALGRRAVAAVTGVALLALLSAGVTAGVTGWPRLAGIGLLVGGALWLGSAIVLATATLVTATLGTATLGTATLVTGGADRADRADDGADDPGRLGRRLAPVLAGATVLVALGLVARALATGLRPDQVSITSAAGLTYAAAAATLACAAVVTGLAARTRRTRSAGPVGSGGSIRQTWLIGVAPVLVVGGLVLAAAAGAVPAPPEPATAGAPLLRTVALGSTTVQIAVAPQRPGPNLVYVTAPGVRVQGVVAEPRSGSPGGWTHLNLDPGTRELALDSAEGHGVLRLDLGSDDMGSDPGPDARTAGLAGPDGPECLSAVVAAEISGTPLAGCPSDALDPRDATAIRATVGLIADRRAPNLNIISDSSPRSARAAAVATEVARARGLPLTDAPQLEGSVLMVAGWEVGGRRLIDEALGLSVVFGTYTAPWLATQSVLGRQTGAVTTLDFDPRDVPAQRYLAGLRSAGMVELAAPSGFRAWDPEPSGTAPRVFSAAQVSVMPADVGGSDHHRSMDRWLPGGTFTPVTPPLQG